MAGYVDLNTWKKYATKRDEDAAGEALYQTFLDSSEQIVADYLSYDPQKQDYTHTVKGVGTDAVQLRAKPISVITSVTIDGVSRNVADFHVDGEYLYDDSGALFSNGSSVVVEYTAGNEPVPGIIQLTVMRIASLLSMESGENIGVTSTSFDGGNSRTFINYTNFSKYLSAISSFRVVRL